MAWKLKMIFAVILSIAGFNPMVYAHPSQNGSGQVALTTFTTLTGNHNDWFLKNAKRLGPASPSKLLDLSIILKAKNDSSSPSLTDFVQHVSTPTDKAYRQFLTATTFKQNFSPSDNDVNQMKQFLIDSGFTIENVFSNNLVIRAQAPIGTVEKAFRTTIYQYQYGGGTFYANERDPQVPANIATQILAITGMTTFADFTSHAVNTVSLDSGANNDDSPPPVNINDQHGGVYGPQKVQDFYNIMPLYQKNDGRGTTLAIATLANFNPNDATCYWNHYGINHTGKVSVIPIDGGFSPSIPVPGFKETTLDVEQAGALAPGANIDVYEAPNTNTSFLDLFYRVAAENTADSLSVGWGEDEKFESPAYHAALNQAFLAASAEGISMFAAAGDNGAYDSGGQQTGVDSPASDPDITAVGGTIYPGMAYHDGGASEFANIQEESVWGWDFALPYYASFGYNNEYQWKQQIFSIGGGGGFSSAWALPWYQTGLTGVNSMGRNVPDISMNADPFAGYTLYDSIGGTPDNQDSRDNRNSHNGADGGGYGWSTGWGGTSFVAAQMNGIAALMDSMLGGRLGFLNPSLYSLAGNGSAYGLPNSPFNDVSHGDNWDFIATEGYDDGSGIGSPNVTNLETALMECRRTA